jgi:hypothetical protein
MIDSLPTQVVRTTKTTGNMNEMAPTSKLIFLYSMEQRNSAISICIQIISIHAIYSTWDIQYNSIQPHYPTKST